MKIASVLGQHLGRQGKLGLPDLARGGGGKSYDSLLEKPPAILPDPVTLGELEEKGDDECEFGLKDVDICFYIVSGAEVVDGGCRALRLFFLLVTSATAFSNSAISYSTTLPSCLGVSVLRGRIGGRG